jgi:hypothetical protein
MWDDNAIKIQIYVFVLVYALKYAWLVTGLPPTINALTWLSILSIFSVSHLCTQAFSTGIPCWSFKVKVHKNDLIGWLVGWLIIDWLTVFCHTHVDTTPLMLKGCKFNPILSAQGLWAGMDLYDATPTVTWGLDFPVIIQNIVQSDRFLRHARGDEQF